MEHRNHNKEMKPMFKNNMSIVDSRMKKNMKEMKEHMKEMMKLMQNMESTMMMDE